MLHSGQGLKDIIRWPRPMCPPVVRLEKKWEMEYGKMTNNKSTLNLINKKIFINN